MFRISKVIASHCSRLSTLPHSCVVLLVNSNNVIHIISIIFSYVLLAVDYPTNNWCLVSK